MTTTACDDQFAPDEPVRSITTSPQRVDKSEECVRDEREAFGLIIKRYLTADGFISAYDITHIVDDLLKARAALAQQASEQDRKYAGFLQEEDQHLLHSFIETTSDDEGYAITKQEIKRLADLGVVSSHGFGRYGVTMFGYWAHENYWEQKPSLPLKTNSDRDKENRASIQQSEGE